MRMGRGRLKGRKPPTCAGFVTIGVVFFICPRIRKGTTSRRTLRVDRAVNAFSDLSLKRNAPGFGLIGAFYYETIRRKILDKFCWDGATFAIIACSPIEGRTKKSTASPARYTRLEFGGHG